MPNFLEMLRLKNIFGQPDMIGNDLPSQGGITGSMPFELPGSSNFDMFNPQRPQPMDFGATTGDIPPTLPQSGANDIASRMASLYTPETAASDRYNQLIGEYPQREKPGLWRTAASILTALGPGGHEMGMQVAEQPFRQKMEDWKTKIGPAGSAATLERHTNANERQMAYQTASIELRGEADKARAAKDEARTKIMEDRAQVYRLKSIRPNVKFDFSGPEVIMTDSTGKIERTGISTGSLSDADKFEMQQEHALERIGATGDEARKTEDLRQTGREGLAEQKGWVVYNVPDPANPGQQKAIQYNPQTREVADLPMPGAVSKPGSGTESTENATQSAKRQFSNARRLVLSRPDLARFLTVKKGDFGLKGKPSPAQLKEINDAIYGTSNNMGSSAPTGNKVPPTMTPDIASRIPAGRVAMFKDGQTVTIPQDQLQQAIEEGYVQVK